MLTIMIFTLLGLLVPLAFIEEFLLYFFSNIYVTLNLLYDHLVIDSHTFIPPCRFYIRPGKRRRLQICRQLYAQGFEKEITVNTLSLHLIFITFFCLIHYTNTALA